MVRITLNTIPIDGPLSGQISATILNQAAERYAKELETYLAGRRCEIHSNRNQDIIVTADRRNKMVVEMENFCCDRFKDSIEFVPR